MTTATQTPSQEPGMGRVDALRRAMLSRRDGANEPAFAHPIFWAPFMNVGEGARNSLFGKPPIAKCHANRLVFGEAPGRASFVFSTPGSTMQTRSALSHPFCAGALSAVLALVWFDSALAPEVNPARRLAQHVPRSIRFATPETGVQIQRVDFVLDQAPPTKDDEAQKKRKAEQRRAAAAKSKPNVKAASEAGAPRGTPP